MNQKGTALTSICILIGFLIVIYFLANNVSATYIIKKPESVPPETQTTPAPETPYVTDPIKDLDDYEYSLVFRNEGSRETRDSQINYAMSRYPLDWSTLPPDNGQFQVNREAFINTVDSDSSTSLQKGILLPPDSVSIEEKERKILQTYTPATPSDLLTYSLDDVKTLVEKIYDNKGLNARVESSKQGPNVYEIVEVSKKNEPIIWEDEQPPTERQSLRGEMQITVPTTVSEYNASLDPFYEPRTSIRSGRSDYSNWNSGLERQFAPTYPTKYRQ